MRWLRLPASPIEHSAAARAWVLGAFAVSVVAVALYGQDIVIPFAGVAVAAAGHLVSYRERNDRRILWRQLLLASLIGVAVAYLLADSVLALFGGVLPQANFAILLVAITSFDLKTRRNCYSSLWISLAVLYLAAVYAWDYAFGLLAALWALCLFGFWAASHTKRLRARSAVPPRAAMGGLVATLAAGAVLFVAMPQPSGIVLTPLVVSVPNFSGFSGDVESPALPLVALASDSSGATNSVDLHYRGRLGGSAVMYVRTAAPAYWRGLVFDTYRNGSWTASLHSYRTTDSYVPPRILPPSPQGNRGMFVQVFRVLRPMPGVLYAAYPMASLYAPFATLREDAYGTFHAPGELTSGSTYSVVSYLPDLSAGTLRAGAWPVVPPAENPSYLDTGGLSSAARSLAASVTAGLNDEYDVVIALTSYLQSTYRYSIQLGPVPAGVDPVDWFLFDAKVGYCEQFATAEALMLRSLGIPARLVTGYAPGTYDPVLDLSVVREKDAHAWVEAWFGGHGWVPIDPTPGVAALAAATLPSHWAAGGLAGLIPHLTVGGVASLAGPLGALAGFGAIPAAAAGAVLGILVLARWARRRRKFRAQSSPGEAELLRLYERLQRRSGRRRAPPETPREYVAAVAGRTTDHSLLELVTDEVNRGVYAGRWPAPARVRELSDRLS